MNSRAFAVSTALAVVASVGTASMQTPPPATVDGLVSAAKRAAGLEWPGTFLRLCVVPPPSGRGGGRGAAPAADPPGPPARSTWYAEPARVADNFYFLGTKIHNAWALAGSDGIILFEALFDYASPDEIADGMRKLGLDTARVKYMVMSHAHGDHDGGARFLQDKMSNARLLYGAPDWDAVEQSTNRPGGTPKRDLVATDGMTLSAGDASVRIVTTPGHTPGTLSYLFEIRDNGRPLRVAYVGGTAIPFDGTAEYYDGYIASVRKMAKAAADFGATVLISNHTEFDNGYFKAHTAADRKPGEANPFDVGRAAVDRYFTVVEDCATAAKLRAAAARR
jgi:metallo-beta-lactamase class B